MNLEELKFGDIVVCTKGNTNMFTKGVKYGIHRDVEGLFIADDFDNIYHLSECTIVSTFKMATDTVINETLGGENTMIKNMTLEGSKVKKIKGGVVIEKAFDISELAIGMQIFDIMMEKWRLVKDIYAKGFVAGDTLYTTDGKLDKRHNLIVVDRMRAKLDAKGLAIVERATVDKFSNITWVTGEKNYYVSFKTDTNEYKVFSEDKLRRIDTVFLTREDAFLAAKELNKLV